MPQGVLDGGVPPPAPNPNQTPGAPPPGGVLSGAPMQAPAAPAAPQGQTPAPTHGQTVAVLRHMDAIETELKSLLKDPAVGKSNIKPKIIDGMATLVARRIVTAGNAVAQLATVPERPFEQKKWLQTHMMQALVAKIAVLTHHGQAFGGMPEQMVDKTSDPDDHIADMQGVMGHYGGARG